MLLIITFSLPFNLPFSMPFDLPFSLPSCPSACRSAGRSACLQPALQPALQRALHPCPSTCPSTSPSTCPSACPSTCPAALDHLSLSLQELLWQLPLQKLCWQPLRSVPQRQLWTQPRAALLPMTKCPWLQQAACSPWTPPPTSSSCTPSRFTCLLLAFYLFSFTDGQSFTSSVLYMRGLADSSMHTTRTL